MKRVALTFLGKDRPGIIACVSEALSKLGCNIEDTTMTLLQGEFAMILIAALPSPLVEKRLKKFFKHFKLRWGLNYFWRPLRKGLVRGEKHPPGSNTYVISVMGKDRTGIVYHTSLILARHGVNITDLNSRIVGEGKKSIFAMVLEADAPKNFHFKSLDREWKKLKSRLKVEVHIRPLARVTF